MTKLEQKKNEKVKKKKEAWHLISTYQVISHVSYLNHFHRKHGKLSDI